MCEFVSESPCAANHVDFATARADKVVSAWKKRARGKGKHAVRRSQLAGSPGRGRDLFSSHNVQGWLTERGLEEAF